ncbi:MAG: lysophospholipid acyltransferase family protein [Flavobacteriales bacterium]|jgi:KDO2-lipid IV(A) lauroyltransferase|tara:strand:+ start:1663 stop:2520 length:858 start_codon:yes stop_codon:yes gene_type:complete
MHKLITILYKLAGQIPFVLLYMFSNFLAFLLQKVFKYRLKVVQENLKKAFPELQQSERTLIENQFYLNFSDILLENLKLYSISKDSLQKRMKLLNPEVFNKLALENKGAILIGAHYNNWEWMALALGSYCKQDLFSVYKPLSNKNIDSLMLKARSRFGAEIVPMKQFPKTILKNKNRATINLMLSDQSPHKSKLDYFCEFLNQDTPVYLGAEKLMNAANLELLFVEVHRVKRGYYEMKIVPLANVCNEQQGLTTELHLAHLEKMIIDEPSNWLWSHRRWKHSRRN